MQEKLSIFIGVDPRQAVSVSTLISSIYRQSSQPVAITPLVLSQLPLKRKGLTEFTYSRFLAPYLCNYEGWSLFLDADMLLLDDIAKLFALRDDKYSIMVSKNKHRFEWASVMLFNNAKCKILTPEYIETANGLHGIEFAKPEEIGELPNKWNYLVGYDEPMADVKLVHYTQGNPIWIETEDCEYSKEWKQERDLMSSAKDDWNTIMGNSVHAAECEGVKMPLFLFDLEQKIPKMQYIESIKKILNDKHPSRFKK